MTEHTLSAAARKFFDDFNAVFEKFSGPLIAERYVVPHLAVGADGASRAFASSEEIGAYFQEIVDDYHSRGSRICTYKDLEVATIGNAAALATVTWELCRPDRSVVTSWKESYVLVLVDGTMKAATAVVHAEPR